VTKSGTKNENINIVTPNNLGHGSSTNIFSTTGGFPLPLPVRGEAGLTRGSLRTRAPHSKDLFLNLPTLAAGSKVELMREKVKPTSAHLFCDETANAVAGRMVWPQQVQPLATIGAARIS
jgi:hypothetical protein